MSGEHKYAQARRVVTGTNADGKSCFIRDELTPQRLVGPGNTKCDIWRVPSIPIPYEDGTLDQGVVTAPPQGGLVFRQTTFAPDSEWDKSLGYADANGQLKGTVAPEDADGIVGMHYTDTVDFLTVLSGELVAVMETGETVLRAGDSIIVRGVKHAWCNRTNEPVSVLSLMISAPERG